MVANGSEAVQCPDRVYFRPTSSYAVKRTWDKIFPPTRYSLSFIFRFLPLCSPASSYQGLRKFWNGKNEFASSQIPKPEHVSFHYLGK